MIQCSTYQQVCYFTECQSFVSNDTSFRQNKNGLIADFQDTITCKNNQLCQKYLDTFLIHLFVYAFETCNESGSHKGIHKLEAMYMCVKNVSSQYQAQLDNIFLGALWYAEDVKEFVVATPLFRKSGAGARWCLKKADIS
jgi:hypothetical protein